MLVEGVQVDEGRQGGQAHVAPAVPRTTNASVPILPAPGTNMACNEEFEFIGGATQAAGREGTAKAQSSNATRHRHGKAMHRQNPGRGESHGSFFQRSAITPRASEARHHVRGVGEHDGPAEAMQLRPSGSQNKICTLRGHRAS